MRSRVNAFAAFGLVLCFSALEVRSAKAADARPEIGRELADSSRGAVETAAVLRTFVRNTKLAAAEFEPERELATGDILIANEKLGDPNFTHSVVLIVQFDSDDGTVGVIVNRKTRVAISQVFSKIEHATNDPVYWGGPVQLTAVQALFRLPEKSTQAKLVMGDVYVSGSKELIEKSVAAHSDPSKFRVYLGYAGWAPGQLEAEIQAGAWSVLSGRPQIVFDGDPESLWPRMTQQLQMQIASLYAKRPGEPSVSRLR
jgi:putative transcriptional regulator